MRLGILILVLLFSAGFGVLIQRDPGYALFAYGDWTVEMPLWLSLLFMIATVVSLLVVFWFIHMTLSSSRKVRAWWKNHQEHSARTQMQRGLLDLAEGRWQNAERFLTQSAEHSDMPLLNYLFAARAAEELGALKRRNQYLELAQEATTGSKTAVRLTKAEFQLKHHEYQQSSDNLEALHDESPKHPEVLRLLSKLYEKTNNWNALYNLLPSLKKNDVFSKETLHAVEKRLYLGLIPLRAEEGTKALLRFWKSLPNTFKVDPNLALECAEQLAKQGEHDEAETLLRQIISKRWHSDIIRLYGSLLPKNAKAQLAFIESFLPEQASDPLLLLSAGRICLRNQLWGRARDYLEKSLALQPHPDTYAELGELMDQLAQSEKRNECFKKGLLLATKRSDESEEEKPLVCVTYEDRL